MHRQSTFKAILISSGNGTYASPTKLGSQRALAQVESTRIVKVNVEVTRGSNLLINTEVRD